MTTVFADGFDQYGPPGIAHPVPNNLLAQGGWSIGPETNCAIVNGLSSQGYAMQFTPFGSVVQNAVGHAVGSNMNRMIGGFKFQSNLGTLCCIAFYDTTVVQCSICINVPSGIISINQGLFGTALQNGTAGVAANTTHELEFDITFAAGSFGGWTVWLDGVQILAGTGATQQSVNASANFYAFTFAVGTLGSMTIDDNYIFSPTGSSNNAALLSNPAVVTQFPNADSAIAFTNQGNVVGNFAADAAGYASGANTLYLIPFTPVVNCTAEEIAIWADVTNNTANFRGVLYADSAGIPGTLLTSGTQVTGCIGNTQLLLPLTSFTALTAGTQYWFGYITDTNINFYQSALGGVTGAKANNTYSSGAPGTAPTMTFNQASLALSALCVSSPHNWASESVNPPPGDAGSVGSNSTGTQDTYTFPALPTNVVDIYSVIVSANVRLTATGSHTFDLVCLSNGTTGTGTNTGIAPTTDYTWLDSANDLDPHTSSAWTYTNAGNATCGMDIVT